MTNFIEIEGTFRGRTDVRRDAHLRPTLFRLTLKRRPKNKHTD